MFNFIRRRTRSGKARSFQDFTEFVEFVKKEGCSAVTIMPRRQRSEGGMSKAVGFIGTFAYTVEFRAASPRGPLTFIEHCFEEFGSEKGISHAEERAKSSIKIFLLAEQKMQELQELLPGRTITVVGRDMELDENEAAKLHQDAIAAGVSI